MFFVDISLAFPSVLREQLLLRLHAYCILDDIWQHLRALHHSIRACVLHGHNTPTTYINILERTHRRRPPVSPSYLGLDIADLVTTRSLQRSVHYITLPPPDPAYFTAVLLYVDDFALLASYRAELLALMQLTLVRKQLPPLSVPGLGFPGRASASPRRRRLKLGAVNPGVARQFTVRLLAALSFVGTLHSRARVL